MASKAPYELNYQIGFGNDFATEAIAGVLPRGRNSPQRVNRGLYTELVSGTAFTVPRAANLRSWTYRIRPSAGHPPYRPLDNAGWQTSPWESDGVPPNQLRWSPVEMPSEPLDFVEGVMTLCGNGDAAQQMGTGVHLYFANRSMANRYFVNADGEMLLVPQQGRIRVETEFGNLELGPGEIAVVNRGVKCRVLLKDGDARGYLCENYGAPLRLPDLGPIGSNGLANPRDFLAPVAAYQDEEDTSELVCKFDGRFWSTELTHSPLDVVAWHGNYYPYKYNLYDFNVLGSVSFDHPDPSIYTVLTSPSNSPGLANVDFVIFPPRWLVAKDTFRPPWYHRNVMSEFMGLVQGVYDAKPSGFVPGGCSLHNAMVPHGPDAESYARAVASELEPQYLDKTMAFMFETRMVYRPTKQAMELNTLQDDYWTCWKNLKRNFKGDTT